MKLAVLLAALAITSSASAAGKLNTPKPIPQPAADAQPDPTLTDEDIQREVRAYLGAIDVPVPPGRWKVLGPRAEPILLAIIQSDDLPTRRAKAIGGLGHIGTSHPEVLRKIAGDDSESYVVRLSALRALGEILPEKEMVSQLTEIMKTSKDVRARAAAGWVLGLRSPKAGCTAVRAQISREPAMNRDNFARAMDACFAK